MRIRTDFSGISIIRLWERKAVCGDRHDTSGDIAGDTAVAVNPEDERYQHLDRKDAETAA